MLLLRVAFLELALCLHVIGAAVLFRRIFPRESPWLAFTVPILALLSVLNFTEHFVALPNLGWLLPFTIAGLIWAMVAPGFSWEGMRFPSIVFVAAFSFVFLLKCLSPDIPNYTEGTGNLTRVLNYSLGGTLPPIDCFLPPFDYGGYYSFQQYGAAILKRLFFLDIGTAYNLSFALLLAWMLLLGAGVAHSITGKKWIAAVTVIVLLACATGSGIYLVFFGPNGIDFGLSTCLNDSWNDKERNPFWWFSSRDAAHPVLKLLPPTYTLYYSEFHANLGGSLVTMAVLLACSETLRPGRWNWPWICLIVLPMMTLIVSAWFFPIIFIFCAGGMIVALMAGRRPRDWQQVCVAGGIGLVLLWPSVLGVLGNPATQDFHWAHADERTPLWMFAVQWWPLYVPWILLCFVWDRLNLMGRWMTVCLPVLLLAVEFSTFGDRGLTTEKMWGELYGAGLVTLLPIFFMQGGILFRSFTVFFLFCYVCCLGGWMKTVYWSPLERAKYFHLQGDTFLQKDPQTHRLLQALQMLHGATILPGRSYWAYNEAPALVSFSENRCYVAYYHQEAQAGHREEAEYRSSLNNAFYRGELASPLEFLRSNDIAAVMIWPEDTISDGLLQKIQSEIGSEYYYVNCKMDGVNNAGVFFRQNVNGPQGTGEPEPLDLSPLPDPAGDAGAK